MTLPAAWSTPLTEGATVPVRDLLRVSFADEKSQKSPQVKTLNAGHFFWAGVIRVTVLYSTYSTCTVYPEAVRNLKLPGFFIQKNG